VFAVQTHSACGLSRSVANTSEALVGTCFFSTGVQNSFAASGEATKDILPKSSMQHREKYF
jgi:hypothetical protein